MLFGKLDKAMGSLTFCHIYLHGAIISPYHCGVKQKQPQEP